MDLPLRQPSSGTMFPSKDIFLSSKLAKNIFLAMCKNRHPSPICTRFEHHFHALKPHLHRRSFSDTSSL